MVERYNQPKQTGSSPDIANYVDVRTPTGKLAFRYDPVRHLIQWQERGRRYVFDLAVCKAESKASEE